MRPELIEGFLEDGLISPARMRVVETNAMALGVTDLQLMESAGQALADMARTFNPERILVLCGSGNNGGDGLAAARHLQRGAETDVCYLDTGKRSSAGEHQLNALKHCQVTLHPFQCSDDLEALHSLFDKADVIIDALIGIGVIGAVREPLLSAVMMANASGAQIIAVDVPTPGMRADRICAFHRAKMEGSTVVDIGIPLEAECSVGPGELTLLPIRSQKVHKGIGGEVLVIGGGQYQGAPWLAGLGALRAGADIVRIASPIFEPVPDLIYERLEGTLIGEEHKKRLINLAGKADVVICGNGLGDASHNVIHAVVPHCKKAVIDADALRLPLPVAKNETLYTPHAGEFTRITGVSLPDSTRKRALAVMNTGLPGTVLLKGHIDIISDGKRVRFNRTGHPAMTVGGTGDVLAGIAGALLCHLPAFESGCIAAYVNGRAGEIVAAERGEGMLATDLVDRIPAELFKGRSLNG
jgi:ADP-dependent NAD(P)H-hydrate dehydratase / NAD(P)H-hydrate epimerase